MDVLKYIELVMERLEELSQLLAHSQHKGNPYKREIESLILINEKMLIALERTYQGFPVLLTKTEYIPLGYIRYVPLTSA